MRKRVLTFIAACFYYSGLVKVARWWIRHSGQRLVILNYHRATGGDLRSHLLYLCRHYRVLHLERALEELFTLAKDKQQVLDQRMPLVLTFDDGYHDNYTHGLALARELQVPITIFLIPGYAESGDYFWWLEGKRVVTRAQASEITIEGGTYRLNQLEERKALARVVDERLRYAASVAEREAFLMFARELLAVPSSVAPEEKPGLPLTWREVREMEQSGYVSFGAHTRAFAYPVGQLQHIGNNVIHAVQQAGYDWALTTIYGFNTPQSDPHLLRRIEVDVSQHWLVIAAEVAGLWGFFSRLRWIPLIRKYFTNAQA